MNKNIVPITTVLTAAGILIAGCTPHTEPSINASPARAVVTEEPVEIPAEHLVGAIAELRPVPRLNLASVAQRDQQHAQLWPAIEGQLHPALDLIVTVPVESTLSAPVGPPVTGVDLSTSSTGDDHRGTRRVVAGRTEPPAPGALVRSPRGVVTANGAGNFLVPADVGDEIVLDDEPDRRVTVPAAGGVQL